MPLSPHLRAALIVTIGAAAFVLLLVTRLVGSMMADPNFGRGDNPFELLSLLTCVLGPLLALGTAVGLAFKKRWAGKVGWFAATIFLVTALAILANFAIAGTSTDALSGDLVSAQTWTGLASFGAAAGMYLLLRRLPAK
jgi:hypothetical protein